MASEKAKGPKLDKKHATRPRKNERILTLSGGGFKAGLYHLGSLQALNELGELKNFDAFNAVSGGSVTLAWLALNWSQLKFDGVTHVASKFDELIYDRLFDLYTQQTFDSPAILQGVSGALFSKKTVSNRFADLINARLFKDRTLRDFPDQYVKGKSGRQAPAFYISSTDMRTNTAWYFCKGPRGFGLAQNYLAGKYRKDFRVADVVAASAAFPPFFSPMLLEMPDGAFMRDGQPVIGGHGKPYKSRLAPSVSHFIDSLAAAFDQAAAYHPADNSDEPSPGRLRVEREFRDMAVLGDGGLYDNLGLERAKSYKKVWVSNAGDPFGATFRPKRNWYSQFRGIVRHMHRQVEQRRKIHQRDLAEIYDDVEFLIWEIDDHMTPDAQEAFGGLTDEEAWIAATFPVRLKKTDKDQAKLIVEHGASMTRREVELWRKTKLRDAQQDGARATE
ncbi:MAG: patatin-like phospholipase family protein [Pseudomonadota bacterium]